MGYPVCSNGIHSSGINGPWKSLFETTKSFLGDGHRLKLFFGVWESGDGAETQPTHIQLQPTLPTHMDGSTWVIVSHLGSFCYWGQFQHLYTLACNWAEIGANMSERCRNLMIIKVITRPACLIRRVLFPTGGSLDLATVWEPTPNPVFTYSQKTSLPKRTFRIAP